ncbi:hypothetical protein BKA61DRAFT_720367 [Leptodontidium sp. MPI-SDFR-AT-0119]|nr:hypothetical protein BKA61DRAFT_720367 [Leptodontidium sp. MPI-SDFR-AT-0119]
MYGLGYTGSVCYNKSDQRFAVLDSSSRVVCTRCEDSAESAGPLRSYRLSFFDEKFCKLDNVQGELSMLQAWLLFWIYLVALPMTIPLGALADTVGRKAVIAMSLVAVTLMKVWVIIVAFRLLGGYQIRTMVTAITDVVSGEKRTSVVLIVSTMALVTEVLAPPLGSLIMIKTTPLIGFTSATVVEFSVILVLLFIPETLSTKPAGYESLPSEPSVDQQNDEPDIVNPKYNLREITSLKVHDLSASLI